MKPVRSSVFFILLPALWISAPAWGLDVVLARLALLDETGNQAAAPELPHVALFDALSAAVTGDALAVRMAEDSPDAAPQSFLDAAKLCQSRDYPYLLYGYVKKTEFSYSAEVKLLEKEHKELAAVFFAGDDRDHYQRMMADLASKIMGFFYKEAGLKDSGPDTGIERNVLIVPAYAGFWAPLGPDWSGMLAGIASAGGGVRFIPARPLFGSGQRTGYVALGADVEYAIGMNNPGYEGFVVHTLKARTPVEMTLNMAAGHSIGMGLGLLFKVDILSQARNYAEPYLGVTAGMGCSLSASYRYEVDEGFALGFSNVLDLTGYAPALIEYSGRIFVDFTFRNAFEGKKQ